MQGDALGSDFELPVICSQVIPSHPSHVTLILSYLWYAVQLVSPNKNMYFLPCLGKAYTSDPPPGMLVTFPFLFFSAHMPNKDTYQNRRQHRKLSDAALALLEMRKLSRCPFCGEFFCWGEESLQFSLLHWPW